MSLKKSFPTVLLLICSFSSLALAADDSCTQAMLTTGGPCLEGGQRSSPGLLEERHRNVLGFILGKSDFQAAARIFGDAKLWHSGDAAGSENKVCYLAGDRANITTIVIASNSEMSGGAVDGIRAIQGRPTFADQCARTAVDPNKVQTRSGIRLGLTSDEVKTILGQPADATGKLKFFSYCENKKLNPGDERYAECLSGGESITTRCSGITAHFEDGTLRWMDIEFGSFTC